MRQRHNLLKKKYVRFWLVHFIMLPTQALQETECQPGPFHPLSMLCHCLLTCVIPSPLHSSSHNSFKVPLDGSKYSFGMAFSMFFGS